MRSRTKKQYSDPDNAADALATAKRILAAYNHIQQAGAILVEEDQSEWDGDASDELYKSEQTVCHAIMRLVRYYDLPFSLGEVAPEGIAQTSPQTPPQPPDQASDDEATDDEAQITANRLVMFAESITDLTEAMADEELSECSSDPIDALFKAKETLLNEVLRQTFARELSIRVVKRAGKGGENAQ